ncbi:unnamed protein product, partial [Strongylus vulgaris]
MFRKPDDDDYLKSRKVVKAKPFSAKCSQKLSMTGKDFVSSGCEGGGAYTRETTETQAGSSGAISDDERNKIYAKILKAEMKGDM